MSGGDECPVVETVGTRHAFPLSPGSQLQRDWKLRSYNHEINSAPSDTDERVIRTARGVNSRNDVTRASNMRQRRARTCLRLRRRESTIHAAAAATGYARSHRRGVGPISTPAAADLPKSKMETVRRYRK